MAGEAEIVSYSYKKNYDQEIGYHVRLKSQERCCVRINYAVVFTEVFEASIHSPKRAVTAASIGSKRSNAMAAGIHLRCKRPTSARSATHVSIGTGKSENKVCSPLWQRQVGSSQPGGNS